MLAPEDQQIEICLLKSNLEEIENDLVVQRTALPTLDVESEQQYRETMNALRIARTINSEVERLKQENVRLIAKRMQLKRQCEEAALAVENSRENRDNLLQMLTLEDKEEEELIRKYEDSLRDKAERFRKARVFYNEEEMNKEIEGIEATNADLLKEVGARERAVDQMYLQLDAVTPDVPNNILDIVGKSELEMKLKELTDECGGLEEKRSQLQKSQIRNIHFRRATEKMHKD
ncbi:uncharacterized protein LOC105392535 [Plutella xylostella]|uniref:uncharacterized protein LOC105392535 n=1 Tax=Plutella xylostella TaxID=51655 RepID=UPI0018D1A210|nr:uncharacterized protein LOC105392535 [Plutella xylostella]